MRRLTHNVAMITVTELEDIRPFRLGNPFQYPL
jgi:hypothetical protein